MPSQKQLLRQIEILEQKIKDLEALHYPGKQLQPEHLIPLFNTLTTGVVFQDAQGHIIDANPAALKILGLTMDQLLGKTSFDPRWKMITENGDSVSGNDHPAMIALETGEKIGPVIRGVFLPEQDCYVWLTITAIPLFKPQDSKPFMAYATFQDITMQRKVEMESAQNRELLQYIIRHDPNSVVVLDSDMNYVFVSDRFISEYKVNDPNIIGKNHYELFPDIPDKWKDIHQRVLKGEIHECDDDSFVHQDGSIEYTRWKCCPWHNGDNLKIRGLILYTEITTQQKLIEIDHKKTAHQLKMVLDHAADGIFSVDTEGKLQLINKAAMNMLGYTMDELKGNIIHHFHHHTPKNGQPYGGEECSIYKAYKKGVVCKSSDEIFWRKDGFSFPVEFISTPIIENNKLAGAVVSFQDITLRKKSEDHIKQLNNRLFQLIEIINKLSAVQTRDQLQNTITQGARMLSGATGSTFIIKEDQQCFYAKSDTPGALWEGERFNLNGCVSGWALLNNTPVYIPDIYNDDRVPLELYRNTFIKALSIIPSGGVVPQFALGYYWDRDYVPDENEKNLLRALVDAATIAFNNVGLLEELKQGIVERSKQLTAINLVKQQLEESESRFRRLAENAQDLIYRFEFVPQRRFAYVSPSSVSLTGYTPEEHYADPDLGFKLVHPDDRSILEELSLTPEDVAKPVSLRWIKKEGSVVWCEQRNVPVFSSNGEFIAIEGVARDVTAVKEREIELKRKTENLSQLLEIGYAFSKAHNTGDLLQKIADSAVQFIENGSSAIYLLRNGHLFLEATYPPLPPQMPDAFRIALLEDHPHIVKAIETGEVLYMPDVKDEKLADAERAICDARDLRTLMHLPMIYSNKVLGVLIIGSIGQKHEFTADHLEFCRILTLQASLELEETRLAEEKHQHQSAMEREIIERKKAEELAAFKQRFLANMSHEIRTPLTGILGVIDLLSESMNQLTHDQRDYILILRQTSENLLEIVNQVLDFSKIHEGKVSLKYSAFNLKDMISNACVFFSGICSESVDVSFNYSSQLPEVIIADKGRISQIINNLLSNAAKFTEKGFITLFAIPDSEPVNMITSDKPDELELSVKIFINDSGKGIDKQKQKDLFNPFVQADDSDNRIYEGTGLGLSISKQLAELHGGDAGVESELGKGSSFWFTFKASYSLVYNQDDLFQNNDEISAIGNLKILLAEDKSFNQKVISLLLHHLGHDVVIACNGDEVLNIFKPGKFDLVLMDIQMPVMDGVTATRKLRETFDHLPPIVGLSANAFEGDREKYMSLGMDEYITKPFKKDDFELVIHKLKSKGLIG